MGGWCGWTGAVMGVTAVATALKDDGLRSGDWTNVALSVGAIIYDFGGRRLNEIYPDKRLAQAAFRDAEPEIRRGITKGVLHLNTASRKISRLSRRVRALAPASVPA